MTDHLNKKKNNTLTRHQGPGLICLSFCHFGHPYSRICYLKRSRSYTLASLLERSFYLQIFLTNWRLYSSEVVNPTRAVWNIHTVQLSHHTIKIINVAVSIFVGMGCFKIMQWKGQPNLTPNLTVTWIRSCRDLVCVACFSQCAVAITLFTSSHLFPLEELP